MNYSRFLNAARRLLMLSALVFAFASVASAEWKEKVLYSFQGLPNDGAYPAGGVVFDQAGNLYGATTDGGANNCPGIAQCGTVFQLQPPVQKGGAWSEDVLYVFKGVNSNDGNTPVGGVIFDQAGNLYGTTAYGGTGNCMLFGGRVGCGTVYKLMPPKQKGGAWTETVLHSFQSGEDGYFPWGDLTFDSAGNLYGATQYGGGYGSCNAPYYQFCGTVFKLSPPKTKSGRWTEQILYAFKSGKDGADPNGGLVFDSNGVIYGTTFYGGNQGCLGGTSGCGTVFRLKPPIAKGAVWTEALLLRFKADASMGGNPAAGVTFGANGDLYGTTSYGGRVPTTDDGTVFRLTHGKGGSWDENLLYSFPDSGYPGWDPLAGVIFDTKGNLYGTASGGGVQEGGTVFRLEPSTGRPRNWTYGVLSSFGRSPDGNTPESNLTFDKAGNLYGTTVSGGTGHACQANCGTVFELRP
jgi:uncharacterized repeat protein (TIGR03803 family)